MIEAVQVAATRYTCEFADCKHVWYALKQDQPVPAACPACRSRAWNGAKPLGRPGLYKPRALAQVRRARDISDY